MFTTKVVLKSTAFHGAYAYAVFNFSKQAGEFWSNPNTARLSLEKYLEMLDNYFTQGVLSNAYLQEHHPNIPPEAYMGDFSDAEAISNATHLFELLDISNHGFTFGSSIYADGLGDESIYSYNLIVTDITEGAEKELWSGSLRDFANQVEGGFVEGLDNPSGYDESHECLQYLHTVSLTGTIETSEAFDINRLRIKEHSDSLSAGCIQLNSFSYRNSDTDRITISMTMNYGKFQTMVLKNESA